MPSVKFFLLATKINIPVIEGICWNTENVGPGPLKFGLQLNWADLGQVRQILSIFKGKLLARVSEGVGERWCQSSQQIYRHSARELCCSNSCRRWTNRYSSQKWMKAVGLLLGLISEQASAYFINIMKGNYVLKLNLLGVICLATQASFQESTCEIKCKLILPILQQH